MSSSPAAAGCKVIVVPQPLAAFFYDKLCRRYADRPDVTVIVDRRQSERRSPAAAPRHVPERRTAERRSDRVVWSLAEMPFDAVQAR